MYFQKKNEIKLFASLRYNKNFQPLNKVATLLVSTFHTICITVANGTVDFNRP